MIKIQGPKIVQRMNYLLFLAVICAPGLARDEISLNGTWPFQRASVLSYPPQDTWQDLDVPGYIQGNNYEKAWFRTCFQLDPHIGDQRVKLYFGGVKFDSKVYVNGTYVGGCLNGYNPFELDITDHVFYGQQNELLVGLSDWTALFTEPVDFSNLEPGERERDRTRNVIRAPIGGRYDLYGIWQDVILKKVPGCHIADVFVKTSVRKNQIAVEVTLRNDTDKVVQGVLGHTVHDPSERVLTLPDAQVSVAPLQTQVIEVEMPWSDARLWNPSDPHLYQLHTTFDSQDGVADECHTRFGFREFWCEADAFYLNGTRINLLATSCWPASSLMSASDIRQVLEDVKAGNNKAFRLHTQPWNQTWYHVADEVGLLIVHEAAVWCDSRNYRLSDPNFWSNYGNHLRAAVLRDRNHPSLVMWSLENELLHCGAAEVFAGTSQELARLGQLVKTLDPTRPITYEADLDPEGQADVIGLHYPHEFPNFHLWPNTAYWMDQPISIGFSPGGQWLWERDKPLYIGEFLWVPSVSPDGFTILYGDAPYVDSAYYRNLTKGWTWLRQIEAYREYGVSGMCPWTMFEDPATPGGIIDLNIEENHLYQVQKEAYHPHAVVIKEADSRFFAGQTIERSLTIYNESTERASYNLTWDVNQIHQTTSFALEPAQRYHQTITFQVPSVTGDFELNIELFNRDVSVYRLDKTYTSYPLPALSLAPEIEIALYDPEGQTAELIDRSDLEYVLVQDLQQLDYDRFDMVVVGRNALQEDEQLQVGSSSISSLWRDFTEAGGWIIVLEQLHYPRWMPLSLSVSDFKANIAFIRKPTHPLMSDVCAEDLCWWRGDNLVTAGNLYKPSRGNFQVLVDVGSQEGLNRTALIELPYGKGGYVCSQLLLSSKFDTEPMAGILLNRILGYCSNTTHDLHAVGLVMESQGQIERTLTQIGLQYNDLSGRLAQQNLTDWPVLMIAGGSQIWNEAQASLTKLVDFVEQGGKLLLHQPSEDFVSSASSLMPDLEMVSEVSVPVFKGTLTPEVWSLTNYDLYWIDEPGSWNVPATLSGDIAARSWGKRFNLEDFTCIEAEDMSIKTGGNGITNAWAMYTNASLAEWIMITHEGLYLFGIIARGTPALGEYPRMILRINGQLKDAAVVHSQTWQQYSLSAQLSPGVHKLEIAFTNDAYAPPEDRNLYVDQIRYGLDTNPQDAIFLTRPGVLVQVDRGQGMVLLDEIAWDGTQKNRTKAERLISNIFTDLGVKLRPPTGLRIEAEEMTPIGFGAFSAGDGWARCYSKGQLETTIAFTSTGTYTFEITGYGSPAQGVYPELQLWINGEVRDTVFIDSPSAGRFILQDDIQTGLHTVTLAFVNDFYAPPEDRNVFLDRLLISFVGEDEAVE